MTSSAEADVDKVFATLADPTRRALLELLSERPAGSATTLARHVPISRQAVVKHLAMLERSHLVASHRAGHEVLFSAQPYWLATTAS